MLVFGGVVWVKKTDEFHWIPTFRAWNRPMILKPSHYPTRMANGRWVFDSLFFVAHSAAAPNDSQMYSAATYQYETWHNRWSDLPAPTVPVFLAYFHQLTMWWILQSQCFFQAKNETSIGRRKLLRYLAQMTAMMSWCARLVGGRSCQMIKYLDVPLEVRING